MLKARILTAIVLIPLFLGALFFLPDPAWIAVTMALTFLASREWANLAGFSKAYAHTYLVMTVLLSVFLLWLIYTDTFNILYFYLVSAFFWLTIVPSWLALGWHVRHPVVMTLVGWVVLMPTWLALIDLRLHGPWLLLGIMAVVWIADTAAYFSGRLFGEHKLAPTISPGKTWEGVAGASAAVAVYAWALIFFGNTDSLAIGPFWLIPCSLLLMGFSILGDLFESQLKRNAGLKDSGNILPGHGGILDRIDSMTAALPLAALGLMLTQFMS
ncbi:MAG TPA: phosphatidate cytidylyltransferase [Burkholderiales bacterium]|nr:phosphatidate cytidylyltransferase [Burkholderiales bacterium]